MLRHLGLVAIAAAACAAVAGSAGWIDPALADRGIVPGLRLGGALFAAGVAGGIAGRVVTMLRRGRCVRCGVPIERGQAYCNDHLKATVEEAVDRERARGT